MPLRKVADCRKFPGEFQCSVTISGTADEVLPLALYHAVTTHGHLNTPELHDHIRSMLEDEESRPTR